MKMIRLAIVSTHPIQYYAPIFQALARSQILAPRVFYTWSQTADAAVTDLEFERSITWDIPLLEGYESEFVPNVAERPGTHHFRGLRNPGLIQAIESWRADAVLVFSWNSESHLRVMRHFKSKIPVFFRGDSTLLRQAPWWKTIARRVVLGWIYRHIDVAIAVGSNNRDYYRWCGVPEDHITFAPHAIDTERFSDPDGSHERHAAQWRHELGIPASARTVLFAAKMVPIKDPMLLMEAFLSSGAPGHLIMVGSGVLEPQLRARARGRNDIHFLPFQNQRTMPAVYRLGDVFALPSRSETWGLAVNEAMATGTPVIASSAVGGVRDLLKEGLTGWVFETGSREQLTAALHKALTSDAQMRRSMGEAAKQESCRWSIEAAAEGIARSVAQYTSPRNPFETALPRTPV
jgi:glycosyltransferase involved in cell wall biosynthesis